MLPAAAGRLFDTLQLNTHEGTSYEENMTLFCILQVTVNFHYNNNPFCVKRTETGQQMVVGGTNIDECLH